MLRKRLLTGLAVVGILFSASAAGAAEPRNTAVLATGASGTVLMKEGIPFAVYTFSGAMPEKPGVMFSMKFSGFDMVWESVSQEQVEVPAGDFNTTKMKYSVQAGGIEVVSAYYWYSPEAGVVMAEYTDALAEYSGGNILTGVYDVSYVYEMKADEMAVSNAGGIQ